MGLSVAAGFNHIYSSEILCNFDISKNILYEFFLKWKSKTYYHYSYVEDNKKSFYLKLDRIKISEFNYRDEYGKLTNEYNDFYEKNIFSNMICDGKDLIITL